MREFNKIIQDLDERRRRRVMDSTRVIMGVLGACIKLLVLPRDLLCETRRLK